MNSSADHADKKATEVELIEIISPSTASTLGPSVTNTQKPGASSKRSSQLSTWSARISRPLSFSGSIWVKIPQDIVPGFEIVPDTDESGCVDPRQHVFTRGQKKRLVYLVSSAALFSPLSSNIYFPAIVSISEVRYYYATRAQANPPGVAHVGRAHHAYRYDLHAFPRPITFILGPACRQLWPTTCSSLHPHRLHSGQFRIGTLKLISRINGI
jgi:hypothetical protein